jgi:hypothetical protein
MIAIRIHHNDVPLCVAGASDLAVLTAIVNAVGLLGENTVSPHEGDPEDPRYLSLSVGGLTSRGKVPDGHLRWLEQIPLAIGDSIMITVVETDEVDPPVSRMTKNGKNKRRRGNAE